MGVPSKAALLRLYTTEREKVGRMPFHKFVLRKARERGLAGATVLRGPMGYGQSRRVRTGKLFDFSGKLPIVIEIADAEEKLQSFLASLGKLAGLRMATLEKVEVLHYGKVSVAADPR